MMKLFGREAAIGAALAVMAWSPGAMAADLVIDDTIRDGNPTCAVVFDICQSRVVQHELEIPDVTTSGGNKCDDGGVCEREDFDPADNITYKVSWQVDPADGSVDAADNTDSAFQVALAAVIGEGKQKSNVYCVDENSELNGITAPGKRNTQVTPTKITFCWAPFKPCLQTPEQVAAACAEYAVTNKNYLQAHLIKPKQPINVCSCNPAQFEATFCDPSVPAAQGGCPTGTDPISALATQGVATTGTSTCQRVVIGGRAFFIGDTC